MKARLRAIARHVGRQRETGWRFAGLTALAYGAFMVFSHAHHEFWRDEIHPWSIARTSGFGEILTGDRIYDGHPPGWYWYLRLWTFVTERPWGLHAASAVAATAAAALFARFAPLPRYVKVLLLCSYLFGFEYSVMSRNYVLGWFLVTAACSLYHPLKSRPILLSFTLGMLALTSAYGAIVALCLFPVIVRGSYSVTRHGAPPTFEFRVAPRLVVGVALFGALLVFSYLWSSPPDPNPFSGQWDYSRLRMREVVPALERLVYSFLPLRSFTGLGAWVDSIWFWREHETLRLVACIALPSLLLLALAPAWWHLAFFVLGVGLMNVVQIARYPGSVRHWAHAVILFVALHWLSRESRPRTRNALAIGVFLIVCAFQVQSFAVITKKDFKYPFSGGEETAEYIERAGLADLPIVAGSDYFVVSVTGYLGRTFVSSETREIGQTIAFHSRRGGYSPQGLVARAVEEAQRRRVPVLIISSAELPPPGTGEMQFLFKSRERHLCEGEQFFVYRLAAL